MHKFKKVSAALFSTGILVAGIAAPSAGAQPVVTGGLVNVTVTDIDVVVQDINVGVGVAANVAAALCDTADVNAAVLATQVVRDGDTVTCDTSTGNITFSPVQR
jgi:hypothetical protein